MLCCYIPGLFYEGFCSRKDSEACCRSFAGCRSLLALVAHQRQLLRESGSQGTTADVSQDTGRKAVRAPPSEHQPSRWDVSMHAEKLSITSEEITIKSLKSCVA